MDANETRNEPNVYRGLGDAGMRARLLAASDEKARALASIAAATDPTVTESLVQAMTAFNALENVFDQKEVFFESLRARVPFRCRAQYVRDIGGLEHFFFYWKLAELEACKLAWTPSSAALGEVFRSLATPLIQRHAADLVSHGRLSGAILKQIADLTGVPTADLVMELIKAFARPDQTVGGAVWLAFASFICPHADDGQGQLALKRLLGSEAARLADNVADGAWAGGQYPSDDLLAISSGLVWRMLGSPYASDRWRAAHCLRSYARFGQWDVIGQLVRNIGAENAESFQAPELVFYYMHARLWLLIALARLARDHPKDIGRFREELLSIADETTDHVLMRHFAAAALLACFHAGELQLTAAVEKRLRSLNTSPHPRQREQRRTRSDFYSGRRDAPQPLSPRFSFDYDFQKHDVDGLARVFGKSCWDVADMMSRIARHLDPSVSGMYEKGGRQSRNRRDAYAYGSAFQTYGQQLGWHALFIAAGKLLAGSPVTGDLLYPEEDPWGEWFGRYLLSRDDGLWLSDGTDWMPLDAAQELLEQKNKGPAVIGRPDVLQLLAGIGARNQELVVEGSWYSIDRIRVRISSALVAHERAVSLARKLTREQPMSVWLPVFNGTEDDFDQRDRRDFTPWIFYPRGETRLDEHDPYGTPDANARPYLASEFREALSLASEDPFHRFWLDQAGTPMLRAEAWGRQGNGSEDGSRTGVRLCCKTELLKRLLRTVGQNLLLLIKLERYEAEYRGPTKWTHSVGVCRVTGSLDTEFFQGRVNYLHTSNY